MMYVPKPLTGIRAYFLAGTSHDTDTLKFLGLRFEMAQQSRNSIAGTDTQSSPLGLHIPPTKTGSAV